MSRSAAFLRRRLHAACTASLQAPRTVVVAALALALGACAAPNEAPAQAADSAALDATRTTGLALTYDTLDDTDVAGFNFTATEVDCATGLPIVPANVVTAFEDLEDMYLPGTGGMFENAPFDTNSQHLFSDHFFALPPGCYDVVVQPVDIDGNHSVDCTPASASSVVVNDGLTTEIMLISQCFDESSVGGLDVIAAINHPPSITGIAYEPSKFICEKETTICVTAEDPDSDPVVIVPSAGTGWTLVSTVEDPSTGAITSCFTFAFDGPGDYNITFTAYDLGYDANGVLVTMSDILAAQGAPYVSEDTITVPVHVLPEEDCILSCECPDGFTMTPAGDECIRVDSFAPAVNGTLYRACAADASVAYGWAGAQYPGGLIDNALAFFLDRLNTVGVWACDPSTGAVGTNPIDEWIGFSVCLDVEQGGDYVVGMAADNRLRFRLNGAPTFTLGSSATANFNYWWMNPITLASGLNIVELEGRNDGLVAAFGAEIYGPFAAGSTATDASMAALNYPDNLFWSTLDVIGQPFLTGQASGYSCPDGYALNACEGEVLCTRIERVDCL